MFISEKAEKLQLTNDGFLSVFFLGTGNAFSKKNFQSNFLVIKGSDHVLIDCGTLCSRAFYSYHNDISNVSTLLITHSHADHIGGLEECAYRGFYETGKKQNIIVTESYKKHLWRESLYGGLGYNETENHSRKLTFDDYFNWIQPKKQKKEHFVFYETNIDSINVKLYRTEHLLERMWPKSRYFPAYGVIIDDRLLFSGDTLFNQSKLQTVLHLWPSIETIYHDCQLFTTGVHASFEELQTLPTEVKAKMFLYHYGDNFEAFNAVNAGFSGFAQPGVYYNYD